MEKAFGIYNKILFILSMLSIPIIGIIIKNSNDINIWYRLLNVEALLLGIWATSLLEIISKFYLKINARDYINFVIMLIIVIIFITNKDFLSQQPKTINLKYILMKFSSIGATFYIIPFLFYDYKKNITSILKTITLLSSIFVFSHIFTERYKISTAGFTITAIFLILMFIFTSKEKDLS